jgi:hypothetical protein
MVNNQNGLSLRLQIQVPVPGNHTLCENLTFRQCWDTGAGSSCGSPGILLVGQAAVLLYVPIQVLLDLAKGMTGHPQFLAEAQKLFAGADAHPLAPFLHRRVKSCTGIPAFLF